MDDKQLRFEIARAFADVPQPAKSAIAPHDCLECDELRVALAPYAWHDVPGKVLDACRFGMPLLSADAKQHYLPAWLLRSLDEHEVAGDYRSIVVFALDRDHRWDPTRPYTAEQRAAILRYLDFVCAQETSEWEAQDIERARASLYVRLR
ncbi:MULTISPECIES: DUF6714 family protein [unclassified Lysobacter]|uniref:DUF6714 family protein n=1 Tax=unclassified Lysobacter TaxID=2635362 RepID=UPI001C24A0D3|nr:DUF6714 family protein [Lysobacter sp. MMG2]MBU8977515.1 hypothetical protein [Lysobacter sp. MMG2]